MKRTQELTDAIRLLGGSQEFGVVVKHLEEYHKDLTKLLINTKADIVLAQGMVRSIDQVLKQLVKTK